MRFDPYSFDTKYSDAMLNFLSGQVGEEMSSKRDIEKTLMLEKLKRDLDKKTLQESLDMLKQSGMLGNITGGGAGESYRAGLDIGKSAPMYIKNVLAKDIEGLIDTRTPEEIRGSDFQNKLGAYMTAKNIQKPNVSLVGQPKDVIRRSLLARGIERSLAPEFKGRKFVQGESGAFKESEKGMELSPTLQRMKDKRLEDVVSTIETNNVRRSAIQEAYDAAKKINSGLYGKVKRGMLKNIKPDSPLLGDWQKIKMVLTDAQLTYTAKTKGAISDREMALFADAAANDDLFNMPAIMPVFKKLLNFINAEEKGKATTYKKLYKEDPYMWSDVESNAMDINMEDSGAEQSSYDLDNIFKGL